MELKSVEDTSWLQLFIKNSRNPLVSETDRRLGLDIQTSRVSAYLLPKLRYYFA